MTQRSITNAPKKEKGIQKLKRFLRSFALGLLEGAVSGLIGFLLSLIHFYAFFAIFLFWALFGWFTTYIINNNPLEILTVALTSAAFALLLYYFEGIPIWFTISITGFSLMLWAISFITKVLFYPKKSIQKEEEEQPAHKIKNLTE